MECFSTVSPQCLHYTRVRLPAAAWNCTTCLRHRNPRVGLARFSMVGTGSVSMGKSKARFFQAQRSNICPRGHLVPWLTRDLSPGCFREPTIPDRLLNYLVASPTTVETIANHLPSTTDRLRPLKTRVQELHKKIVNEQRVNNQHGKRKRSSNE